MEVKTLDVINEQNLRYLGSNFNLLQRNFILDGKVLNKD